MAKTLYQKIYSSHVVGKLNPSTDLLYVDRHLIHEVTSPQAFSGLKLANRSVRRPDLTFATMDHNVSTQRRSIDAAGDTSRKQLEALAANCKEFNVPLLDLMHPDQGIVHVIGPEQGLTQPGMIIVCGDSHTSTHGAFGAIAFGIGTSEVEMVLSSQCIMQPKPKKMRINVNGELSKGVTPKDVVLYIISKLTAAGATGYFVEPKAWDASRQLINSKLPNAINDNAQLELIKQKIKNSYYSIHFNILLLKTLFTICYLLANNCN